MRSLLLALWLLAAPLSAQEHLEVRFIDVGQGDAVLVSHAGRHLLYDAGPRGSGVATRLVELGVDTLDLLVASHPHADHIAGVPPVLDSISVLQWTDAGTRHDSQIYQTVTWGLRQLRGPVRPDSLARAELHWLPPPEESGLSLNDRSLGLRICLAAACLSLGGDAEHAAWAHWLEEGLVEEVAVHKASHHGSANGDTSEAMALLSPELVVIGVGQGNRFDHPRKAALNLYDDVGARVLRTDYHGEVVVELHADGEVRTWVERWDAASTCPPGLSRVGRRVRGCGPWGIIR